VLPLDRATAVAAIQERSLEILRLPPGAPLSEGSVRRPEVWLRSPGGGAGGQAGLDQLRVSDVRYLVSGPLIRTSAVEAWRDVTRLPLAYTGILGSVSCRPGTCWLSDDGTVELTPPATGDTVQVTLRLRDRVVARHGEGLVSTLTENVPVARCELRPVNRRVLGGTVDHRVALVLGERCPKDLSDLAADTTPATGAWIEKVQPDQHRLEVRLGAVPRRIEALELRLLRGSTRTVVGTTRLEVHSLYSPSRVQLTDPALGELPLVPTNRAVKVTWASDDPSVAPALSPVAVPGYYTLETRPDGTYIRGESRTAGSIPIRFGYQLPGEGGESAVTFDSDVRFPVRPVNVPVTLSQDSPRTARLAKVICRDAAGHEKEVAPGDLVSLPYGSRNSCRLTLDRSVLTAEDGVQRIRVTLSVTKPDGGSRDGGFSRVLLVTPGKEPLTISLASTGSMRPFDHLSVRIAHDDQPGHYLVDGEAAGLPARSWQMVFGDQRLRLYASATVPTGLYRVTSRPDGGALQFSAGALARLALLSREGKEFPFDLEFGVLGTNLSGQANLSIVAGAGLTVPILNPQELAQAAVGIHVWLEFSPTRAGSSLSDRVAFIFGPSLSLGDFGTNL
jgi:hypothetical protein